MSKINELKCRHIIIYHDKILGESTGLGWCVESSDSEMTVRFGTMAGALAYAKTEEVWLTEENAL